MCPSKSGAGPLTAGPVSASPAGQDKPAVPASWLAHCKAYVDMIVPRLKLTGGSQVLEVACNDGYLLQYFQPHGIPARGIEPAENVAAEARRKGIDVRCCFFGAETAREIASEDGKYDLVIGNNVLAHVPDINSFAAGLAAVLLPRQQIGYRAFHAHHPI